jgi:hypothetical protein
MKKTITSLLLLSILFVFKSFGTTYYVQALTGYDGNPGTYALPWLTIQHAADVMVAGDSVLIRTGIYSEQIFTMAAGNSSAGNITFAAYPGDHPVIDGTDTALGSNCFMISHDYTSLDGIEFSNWRSAGIWVEDLSDYKVGFVEIKNCTLHNILGGCISFSEQVHDFLLDNDNMYHYYGYGFDATNGSADSSMNAYNGLIKNCRAHDALDTNNNDGFALGHSLHRNITFDHDSAYNVDDGFDLTGHNIHLNACVAHDCIYGGGYKLWSDSLYLTNCIGYDCPNANVELETDDNLPLPYWQSPKKVVLMNCIFYNAGQANIGTLFNGQKDTLVMYNCIIAGSDYNGIAFGDTVSYHLYRGDYNLFQNDVPDLMMNSPTISVTVDDFASGYWTALTGQDSHSHVQYSCDSIFLDTLLHNLHYKSTAWAIDHGTSVGSPSVDFDNYIRPWGAGYDIGAYEYGSHLGIFEPNTNDSPIRIYPNPSKDAITVDFGIPQKTDINISIYDAFGKLVNKLFFEEGEDSVNIDLSSECNGIYLLCIQSEKSNIVKKLSLIK